jgi:hypothetical protein
VLQRLRRAADTRDAAPTAVHPRPAGQRARGARCGVRVRGALPEAGRVPTRSGRPAALSFGWAERSAARGMRAADAWRRRRQAGALHYNKHVFAGDLTEYGPLPLFPISPLVLAPYFSIVILL